MTASRLRRLALLALITHIACAHLLNPETEPIGFQSLKEYRLFLDSNDLPYTEPGYLVKCIAANENKHAACLDGSPQAFYYRPGSNESAHKFHIFLQGGGWCCPQCDFTCYDRTNLSISDRGSSIMDPPYLYYPNNYLSNDPNVNPLSWDWNTVYIRYCDGASFSGNNDSEILTENGTPLYFKGFKNLNAVLDILRDEYGLLNATDVLLSGSSAGGLAVYLHTDHIASYLGVKQNEINFMAMADSGWFMDYEGEGQYTDKMQWVFEAQNTSIGLNQKCLEKVKDGHKCMFAQHMAPFIESKLMAIQSRFDLWQIGHELCSENASEINEYGQWLEKSMMDQFAQSRTKGVGERMLYLDSCEHHVFMSQWRSIAIDGFKASQVQVDFWFNNTDTQKVFRQNKDYPCDACCTNASVEYSKGNVNLKTSN